MLRFTCVFTRKFPAVTVSIRKRSLPPGSLTVLDSNSLSSQALRHFPGHLDRMLHLPSVIKLLQDVDNKEVE